MLLNKRVIILSTLLMFSAQIVEAGPYNKPIYNPETKSYFELYNPTVKTPGAAKAGDAGNLQFFWEQARDMAAAKIYKGVRGRLAVVKSASTHKFLEKNFKVGEQAWIGLRYWCNFRKLQWVTGEVHRFTAFQRWGYRWNVEGAYPTGGNKSPGCDKARDPNNERFLPVHYWSTKQGFFWNANGYRKRFTSIFIEYPTGKP